MKAQIEEKARLLEFAAIQAGLEEDNPVLARPLHNYRTSHRLTLDQMINWLGLQNRDEFYRLALRLKPNRLASPLDWRDYAYSIGEGFPGLNLKRLRLVIETEQFNKNTATNITKQASSF